MLKVDQEDRVSLFGSLPAGGYKCYGGVYCPRAECMVCVPFSGRRVVKVDLAADKCAEIGPDLGPSPAKWHGGTLGPDGVTVYGFPAHASSVLAVRCDTDEVTLLGELTEAHNGGKYKYGGGVVADGKVYGIPSDATSVLRIEGTTVTTFGSLERRKNKWQNGAVGRDGLIYCVPCDADSVLVIDPWTDALRLVHLFDHVARPLGGIVALDDQFQGGYVDSFGRVWCVPENSRRVLKLTPESVCDEVFVDAYLCRLGLARSDVTLEALVERHLESIPFENVDNHVRGRCPRPDGLSRVAIFEKFLVRRRGGDCFELNCGLLYLLEALGHRVELVPCRVYAGKERGRTGKPGFRAAPSHHALLVDSEWFVDVGLGEGPLWPLKYCELGLEQVTPEGMRSRLVRVDRDKLQMEWKVGADWIPRLQWDSDYAPKRPGGLYRERNFVLASDFSNLNRKLVVSKLTRRRKTTLAGTRLKITEPRFADPVVTVIDLGVSNDDRRIDAVRAALRDQFDIPLRETNGLDLQVSRSSPPGLWDHL